MRLYILISAMSLAASTSWAENVKVSTGFFYAEGQSADINVSNTVIKAVPLSVKGRIGKWGVRVGSSYLSLDPGTGQESSGMGDTTLAVSYDLTERPWFTVTVKEKFSTGDKTKGLSTGYNDTKLQLDYFSLLGKGASVFATAGYTFKGGKDQVSSYQDAPYASIGMGRVLGGGWNLGSSLDYTGATSVNLEDMVGVSMFVGKRMSPKVSTSMFASYDNTETASIGFGISYKFK